LRPYTDLRTCVEMPPATLQRRSIRLSKALIEDFKFIADANGLKYQTLMRQTLARFAEAEKRQMQNKAASQQRSARKFA